MNKIQVLDQITIDKIAAGEVVERPASVVKELVENSIDAGATAITVEIKDGGISFIRIADNGCGMERSDVPAAFLRHSTSKIHSVDDLTHIASLGFRGEALSSIAAVAQVELITKTKGTDFGTSYRIAGGAEESLEDIGAPEGTTFLIRQLFYNTPARRKFLKTPMTEAGHVGELMTRLALSRPEISFQWINNGQSKLHTSGNGNLKDVIYHVYGREIAANLLSVCWDGPGIKIGGFLGKPLISRGNRNYENYFINGRYVKSSVTAKAIEDAYKDFQMQHNYPFVVLNIEIDGAQVDVNVHPTKMELRFHNQQVVYNAIYEAVSRGLHEEELIPHVELSKDKAYFLKQMQERVRSYHEQNSSAEVKNQTELFKPDRQTERIKEAVTYAPSPPLPPKTVELKQLNLFEEKLLDRVEKAEYTLIGQVFDTYWLVESHDNLYIIDQHAAHERILYEHTLAEMKTREFTSQMISPPIVLDLTMQEAELLNTYMEQFAKIGFEIEAFGQESFAVRAVPGNLFGIAKKELLMEMIDDLSDEVNRRQAPALLDEKIASLSCKAAVKGNMRLSAAEVEHLIGELLLLENPYHCPHGRPTMIAMTKRELEKKFKRIV